MSNKVFLNLGCGRKQITFKGYDVFNIDHNDFGQEIKMDLETERLPFKDNSVDRIRADHFLEHLTDTRYLLNECWRVLKEDGEFEIYVPYGLYENQFSPVHKQIITPYWLKWLEKNDNEEYYGYKRWQVGLLETAKKEEKIDGGLIPYEIHCKLQPWKK
jgi:SAM-dependent methyltransferase